MADGNGSEARGAAAPPGWSVLRTTVRDGSRPPAPRGGHSALLVGPQLLVQGGTQRSGGSFEYFSLSPLALDTHTHAWAEPRVALGKGPAPRAWHSASRVGQAVVVFGGVAAGGARGDAPRFDLTRMAWEEADVRGRAPRARSMHAAAVRGGTLVVLGGFDGKVSLGEVHLLDVAAAVWSQPRCEGQAPPPLQSHACAVAGERIFVVGGATVSLDEKGHTYSKLNDEAYTLHTETMTWERVRKRGQLPSPRSYAAIATVDNLLVVLGGWSGKCEPLSSLSTFDLDGLGSWATVEVPGQAPAGVYGHTATVVGTNIVVFGGWDGISPMNAVNVLDTSQL